MTTYRLYEYEKDPVALSLVSSTSTNTSTNSSPHGYNTIPSNEYTITLPNTKSTSKASTASTTTTTTMSTARQQEQHVILIKETNNSNSSRSGKYSSSTLQHKGQSWMSVFYHTILLPIENVLKQLILPINYPHSVRDGYIRYQIYDSIQGLCSYLRNIVCSASILEAAGVGSTTTNAWSAAIIWAIRDGTGLLGSLLYTYSISGLLDAYVKEFRFFADIINDIGHTFDMILPLVASTSSNNTILFWMISSTSVLCKTMCGISAGATKSSITQHFAIQGNMADLNAKESTQETIVTLMGMIGGIYVAKLLQYYESITGSSTNNNNTVDDDNNQSKERSRYVTWVFFIILTYIHIYANYCGIISLRLRTMNIQRFHICFNTQCICTIIKILNSTSTDNTKAGDIETMQFMVLPNIVSPNQVDNEIMFLTFWQKIVQLCTLYRSSNPEINITYNTTSSKKLQEHFHCSLLGYLITLTTENSELSTIRYNLTYIESATTTTTMRRTKQCNHYGTIAISLFSGATSYDELQALVHAKMFISLLNDHDIIHDSNDDTTQKFIYRSYRLIQQLFVAVPGAGGSCGTASSSSSSTTIPLLISILQQKDWDITRFYLGFSLNNTRRFDLIPIDSRIVENENDTTTYQQETTTTMKKDN